MADALSLELTQSPPAIACNTLGSLISLSMDGASESDLAIVFNSALHVVDQNINCNILMLPDPDNVEAMIRDIRSLNLTSEDS